MLIPGVEGLDLGVRSLGRNGDNVAFEMVLARLRQSMGSFLGPRLESHSVRLNPSVATGGNDVVSDVTSASFGATPISSRWQGGCDLTHNFYPRGHPVGSEEQPADAGRTRIVIRVCQHGRTESL